MKNLWLCSFVVAGATAAYGQTSVTPPVSSDSARTVVVTGCVARGDKADPITLTHAMVMPFGSPSVAPEPISAAEPSTPPSPEPTPVSAAATQPQTPAARKATPPSTTGSAIPGAVGTSGTIEGTAPAGSSASTVDGYRLSGVDMTTWIGRRVQIMGTVSPPAALTQAVAVETSERVALAAMPEFRVMSVQPVTGPCPK